MSGARGCAEFAVFHAVAGLLLAVGQHYGDAGPSVCSSSTWMAFAPLLGIRMSATTAAARRWSRRPARVVRQAVITSAEAGWSSVASARAATISVCPFERTTTA